MKLESKDYQIIVVGVGGTGSNLLSPLSRLLNYNKDNNELILIDGDIYEKKNQRNQNISVKQIGMAKSEAMCRIIQARDPEVECSYIDKYITDKEMLVNIINNKRKVPILIGCVDNNSSRKIMHEVFYDNRISSIIYLDSGNGTDQRIGQVITGYKEKGEVKLKPVGDFFPDILINNDTVEKETSCAATMHEKPQNIATNLMAATILFNAINCIIKYNYIVSNKTFFNCENCTIESF